MVAFGGAEFAQTVLLTLNFISVMLSYFINRKFLRQDCEPSLDFHAVGVGLHLPDTPKIWRVPFGFQLVPAGIMALGLLTVRVRTFLLID